MLSSHNNADQHLERFALNVSRNSIRLIGGGKLLGFENRIICHVSQGTADLWVLHWNSLGRSFDPIDHKVYLSLVSCTFESANSDLKLYPRDMPDGHWALHVPRVSVLDPFSGRLLVAPGGGRALSHNSTQIVDLLKSRCVLSL